MANLGRQRLGYLVAPLVPALTVFALVGGMPMVSMQPLIFLAVVYFVSFIVMCVVALPLLAFCFRKRRLLDCLLVGSITGLIVAIVLVSIGDKPFEDLLQVEQILIVALFVASVLSGVFYWLVAYWEPNQAMQTTAKGGG